MKTFEYITKKNKQRQTLKTIGLSLLATLLVAVLIGQTLRILAGYHSQKELAYQEHLSQIAYPNIDSQHYQHMTGVFSGIIHSERSKDLLGEPVAFPSKDTYYDWLGIYEHRTPDSPVYQSDGNRAYSRGSWDKLPVFYNIHAPQTHKPAQELPQLREMEGQLVEVALTFDALYSYRDIQQMVPESLKKNWFWIGTYSQKDSSFYGLDQLYGLRPEHLTVAEGQPVMAIIEAVKNRGANYLADYNLQNDLAVFLDQYGETDFTQAEQIDKIVFAGLVLTGRAEDFQQLEKADWVYASSIGISRPNPAHYTAEME